MARKPRTDKEIANTNNEILNAAINLIIEKGFQALSMRKLARKLNISPTTIYNYYKNKEELYLNILIEGFKEFTFELKEASEKGKDNIEKFKNYIAAFIFFGITKTNLYNIMMVLNVPKYLDFIGTEFESLAQEELELALEIEKLNEDILNKTLLKNLDENAQKSIALNIKCCVHGFISFYNSQILHYITDMEKKNNIIQDFIDGLVKTFTKT